jgi:HSP20 family protein
MLKQQLARPLSIFRPRIFDDFLSPWNEWIGNGHLFPEERMSVPAVNISEDDNNYQLTMAAPGMKKDDFKVDIDGNTLVVSSEKESNKEEQSKKFSKKEYSYSSFSRSFAIPEDANHEKIDAHYEDGILKLTIPKKEEARRKLMTRAIPVK